MEFVICVYVHVRVCIYMYLRKNFSVFKVNLDVHLQIYP